MRRDDPHGLDAASAIHYTVGKEVRETIEKIGGTMPEDLPTPQKSISQIEREQITQLKKDKKILSQKSRPFDLLFLTSLSGFEPLAFRLGVWRAASYIVRFIICLVV